MKVGVPDAHLLGPKRACCSHALESGSWAHRRDHLFCQERPPVRKANLKGPLGGGVLGEEYPDILHSALEKEFIKSISIDKIVAEVQEEPRAWQDKGTIETALAARLAVDVLIKRVSDEIV